jgi:hypothetical protein
MRMGPCGGSDYDDRYRLTKETVTGVDRFFLRIFFVFREDVSRRSGGGEEAGVGDLPELNRGGHGSAARKGNAPAAGMRDVEREQTTHCKVMRFSISGDVFPNQD